MGELLSSGLCQSQAPTALARRPPARFERGTSVHFFKGGIRSTFSVAAGSAGGGACS